MTVAVVLRWVELAVFALLASVSVRRYLRHRESAALYIAAPFTILALSLSLVLTLPASPSGVATWILVRALLSLLAVFPVCLYLFLACFEAPARSLRRYALVLSPLALTLPWVCVHLPAPGQPRSLLLTVYLALFGAQWIGINLGVAWRLWTAGQGLPTAPRRRARTIAFGITGLAIDFVLGVAAPAAGANREVAATTILMGTVSAILVLVGFSPPRLLVRIWSLREEQALSAAMTELVAAESTAEVTDVLLPAIGRLVGAEALALRALSGELLACIGSPPDAAAPASGQRTAQLEAAGPHADVLRMGPSHFRVLTTTCELDVWLSVYAPFFGRAELVHLRSLGSLLELSVSRAQARARESAAAAALLEAQEIAQVGSWSWEEGSLKQSWSEQMSRLFGLAHIVDGPTYEQAIAVVHPDDRAVNAEQFERAIAARTGYSRDYRIVRPTGEVRWVRSRCKAVIDPQTGLLTLAGTAQDITDDVALRERLSELALTDALTGLPNRTLLGDRLTQALAHTARRPESRVAVLFLDIDRFKVINDSLGHEAGDAVLLEVAERLTATIRAGETVARIGGDEFVVVCDEVQHPGDALALAERLQEALRAPLRVGNAGLVVTLSCGIAISDDGDASASSLLRDADEALYRAKAAGRDRSVVFEDTMREETLERLQTEIELRRALEEGQLRVFYQPQVDLASGHLIGVEALVRWDHPTRGLVSPDAFIPIAEETGLIVPLGEWVLRTALEQVAVWQQELHLPRLSMAVNLSAAQLAQPRLAETIRQALTDAGVHASTLELEITESVLMTDGPDVNAALVALHELGVRLSVDDFGTGYSSLAYLRRFPVDALKIDRSFTRGVHTDTDDRAIITAIIALASAMGLSTVAEGVETAEQRAQLETLGCDRGQGYLFARPLPPAEAVVALRELAVPRVPWPRMAESPVPAER
ncbi:MAG: hypothetical protein JWL79_1973 [Frankiales bacterium]|nr:hypothetical protein [Frankiales bacterium]